VGKKKYSGIGLSDILFSLENKNQWEDGYEVSVTGRALDVKKGTLKWTIPIVYKNLLGELHITKIDATCLAEFDGEGGCKLTKKGNDGDTGGTVKRVPSDLDTFLTDPKNYRGTFKYE
jgi:hypothetical protein